MHGLSRSFCFPSPLSACVHGCIHGVVPGALGRVVVRCAFYARPVPLIIAHLFLYLFLLLLSPPRPRRAKQV